MPAAPTNPPAVVRVEPDGLEFEAHFGETLLGAAVRQGFRWLSVCGGRAECRTCSVRVVAQPENLAGIGPVERQALESMADAFNRGIRLACQAAVCGDVTVFKRGVRRRAS